MSEAQKRGQTIAGLVLIALGMGAIILALVLKADKTWPLAVILGLPLVIGALISFPDQIGPIVRELLDKVGIGKGNGP